VRILIVEDERALSDVVADSFRREGFEVDASYTVFSGVDRALTNAYDCILLDVMLPDGDGIEAVAQMRASGVTTPVLMLTVQNEPEYRVAGLNAGADDYVGKPFNTEELIARVYALVRRASALTPQQELVYKDATLHPKSRTLTYHGEVLTLSSKEYLLMEFFFRHQGQLLTRDLLILHVWGPDAEVADNALDTYIYFLRKKAAHIGWKTVIRTVRGQGYVMG